MLFDFGRSLIHQILCSEFDVSFSKFPVGRVRHPVDTGFTKGKAVSAKHTFPAPIALYSHRVLRHEL